MYFSVVQTNVFTTLNIDLYVLKYKIKTEAVKLERQQIIIVNISRIVTI